MSQVISSIDQLTFSLSDIPSMPMPGKVFMVDPAHFRVEYVINPHMKGNEGSVDRNKAREEWETIRARFASFGLDVHVVEGQEPLPDMVFCANQSLPFIDEKGNKKVLMSIMHAEQRKDEVAFVEQWYRQNGYAIHHFDGAAIHDFEGMGDAIWHTGKRLIWGGYGFRSSIDAYKTVAELYNVPVIALELKSDAFYHLDTCFCSLNENTVLIYPKAFTAEGLRLIKAIYPNVIEANTYEAEKLFACNATCPDGKNVVIQEGCTEVNAALRQHGFTVHEVSTAEFLKSGGSVFCMKMMVW